MLVGNRFDTKYYGYCKEGYFLREQAIIYPQLIRDIINRWY